PSSFLLSALQLVNQCAVQYKDSVNKRFHIELMLIELAMKNTDSCILDKNSINDMPSIITKDKSSSYDKTQNNTIKSQLAQSKQIQNKEIENKTIQNKDIENKASAQLSKNKDMPMPVADKPFNIIQK